MAGVILLVRNEERELDLKSVYRLARSRNKNESPRGEGKRNEHDRTAVQTPVGMGGDGRGQETQKSRSGVLGKGKRGNGLITR